MRRYWKQGLFSYVSIDIDSIKENKAYLHVALRPQPRISSIRYNGIKKTEREDLEGRIGLKEGSQLSPNTTNVVKTLIKRYFDEKGYKNAQVDIVQRDDVTSKDKIIVDINIDKQAKVKVNRIYITGVPKSR